MELKNPFVSESSYPSVLLRLLDKLELATTLVHGLKTDDDSLTKDDEEMEIEWFARMAWNIGCEDATYYSPRSTHSHV